MSALVAFGCALVVAVIATPTAAWLAGVFGVVDHPGPLKVQRQPVPYLGGLAVFAALAGPIAIVRPALLIPLGLACALGLADDVADISPRFRLVAEVGVGLAAGAVVAAPPGGIVGLLATAALVVGLVNAVNLIDGLDGLAGGVACASAAGFVLLGGPGRPVAAAIAGALAGFLVFNRPPARIYLGDSGAYLIGAALACTAALALDDPGGASGWAAVPLLVALPVLDTIVAIARRRRAGRPLFQGDRSHVYDQLVDRGRTRVQTVILMIVVQTVLVALGVMTANLGASLALPAAAVVVGALALAVLFGGFVTPDLADAGDGTKSSRSEASRSEASRSQASRPQSSSPQGRGTTPRGPRSPRSPR